jgi:hypothetical protein
LILMADAPRTMKIISRFSLHDSCQRAERRFQGSRERRPPRPLAFWAMDYLVLGNHLPNREFRGHRT